MTLGLVNTKRTTNYEQRITIESFGAKRSRDVDIREKSKFKLQRSKFEKEFWKLIKFGFVGVGAFLIHFCLYCLFTRFLMPNIYSVVLYVLSMGYSMAFNYSAHRAWTFSDHQSTQGSAYRYIIVVGLAASTNSLIFYAGHHMLNFYDVYVVLFAATIMPFITYAGHRCYTFKKTG